MYKRFRHQAVIAAAIMLLSACAIFNGPRTITVPAEKLQASLDKRFPRDTRYMELFDLRLSNPKLVLLEGDRVATTMDVVLTPLFIKKTWKGRITLSGMLQPDALRRAVVVGAPRLDAFSIEGFDPEMSKRITQYGGLLAEQILRNVPIVTYDDIPVDKGSKLVPTRIGTTLEGLTVTFERAQ